MIGAPDCVSVLTHFKQVYHEVRALREEAMGSESKEVADECDWLVMHLQV